MMHKEKVYIAKSDSQMVGYGDVCASFGVPSLFYASIYPLTNAQEAQYYGLRPDEGYKLFLPRDADAAPGDGVWLMELAEGAPPFRVVSSLQWPIHTQIIIRRGL